MKITLLTSRVEQRGEQMISSAPGEVIEVGDAEAQRMIDSGAGFDPTGTMVATVKPVEELPPSVQSSPAPAPAVVASDDDTDDEPALTEDGPAVVVVPDQLAAAKAKKAKATK